MALNIGITVVLSVLIYGFGRYLLGFFTQSEEIISLGMIRLLWVVIPEPLNSVMEVLSDSMRGYGYSLPCHHHSSGHLYHPNRLGVFGVRG